MPNVPVPSERHQAEPPPVPARRHPSPARRARRIVFSAAAAIMLIVVGVAAVNAWTVGQTYDGQIAKIPTVWPTEAARPPVATAEPEAPSAPAVSQNILLLGSDTRGALQGSINNVIGQRSDTMMVVHVPADRKNVFVMSILRDSWLEVPGHGHAKINAAVSYGGVPLAVQTIETLLGARIDHVAIVDFAGFEGVTDALGGVTVDNPVGFVSDRLPGHRFEQGEQHLDGAQALVYARERYAFTDGDFQRVRNQQALIKGMLSGVLSARTMAEPGRAGTLLDALGPYLAVDEGLTSGYLLGLGLELAGVRSEDVSFFTLPTKGTGTSADRQSIVHIDWDRIPALQQAFQTDTLGAAMPALTATG